MKYRVLCPETVISQEEEIEKRSTFSYCIWPIFKTPAYLTLIFQAPYISKDAFRFRCWKSSPNCLKGKGMSWLKFLKSPERLGSGINKSSPRFFSFSPSWLCFPKLVSVLSWMMAPKVHIHPKPVKVNVFGNRVFANGIKQRWGHTGLGWTLIQ